MFSAFLNQPTSHELFTRTAPPGSWGESSPIGKIKNSTAAIFLRVGDNQALRDAANTISELYTDAAMATAWNKLGVVMTAEQYRTAFPEAAAANRASGLADYAESRLAGAAGSMTCLGIKTDVGLGDFKYISPH